MLKLIEIWFDLNLGVSREEEPESPVFAPETVKITSTKIVKLKEEDTYSFLSILYYKTKS